MHPIFLFKLDFKKEPKRQDSSDLVPNLLDTQSQRLVLQFGNDPWHIYFNITCYSLLAKNKCIESMQVRLYLLFQIN